MVIYNNGIRAFLDEISSNVDQVKFNVLSDDPLLPSSSTGNLYNTPAGIDETPTSGFTRLAIEIVGSLGPNTETQTGAGDVLNWFVELTGNNGLLARPIKSVSYDSSNITKNIIGIASVAINQGN